MGRRFDLTTMSRLLPILQHPLAMIFFLFKFIYCSSLYRVSHESHFPLVSGAALNYKQTYSG